MVRAVGIFFFGVLGAKFVIKKKPHKGMGCACVCHVFVSKFTVKVCQCLFLLTMMVENTHCSRDIVIIKK
jgi:hypothetical protein